MVASDFDGLGGYGTLENEGQVYPQSLTTVVLAEFSRLPFRMSVPSLHTNSVIVRILISCMSVTMAAVISYSKYRKLHAY